MRHLARPLHVGVLAAVLAACGGADVGGDDTPATPAAAPAGADAPASATAPVGPAAGAGTARVSLTGAGASVDGDFPATICGAPYVVTEGVAFQAQAGDWRITVASEERQSGEVPLNEADGSVNVVVTANGPGVQLVRGPRNGGSLRIAEDFRSAEADLQLRSLMGDTARLVATFTCD